MQWASEAENHPTARRGRNLFSKLEMGESRPVTAVGTRGVGSLAHLRGRRLAVLAACTVLLLSPGTASAWETPGEIVHGTARLLEKGETIIGVLSPMGYGIHEKVTVFLHPALYLFLTPNVWGRAALVTGGFAVSAEAGYQQSFLSIQSAAGEVSDEYPGLIQAGLISSMVFGKRWQVTLAAGYLVELSQEGRGNLGGVYARAGLDFLISPKNLIMAEVKEKWMFEDGLSIPSVTMLFAREFGRMRVGGGLVFGEFSLATSASGGDTTGTPVEQVEFPVYPWVDAWWRF